MTIFATDASVGKLMSNSKLSFKVQFESVGNWLGSQKNSFQCKQENIYPVAARGEFLALFWPNGYHWLGSIDLNHFFFLEMIRYDIWAWFSDI